MLMDAPFKFCEVESIDFSLKGIRLVKSGALFWMDEELFIDLALAEMLSVQSGKEGTNI